MAVSIRKGKWGHSSLYLKADMSQASSPIWYSLDSPDDWDSTVFQVADARHSWPKAFSLVKSWLKGNPSTEELLKAQRSNPSNYVGKSLTLRNMSLVTIRRLPNGAVAVSGRKMAGKSRKRATARKKR